MFGGEMTPPDQMREAEARGEESEEGPGSTSTVSKKHWETPALSLQGCEAEVSGCVFFWEVARLQQEFQCVLSECSRHSQGDRPKRFHWRAGR